MLAAAWATGADAAPLNLSGSLSYTYRNTQTGDNETTSNYYSATLNAESYLWQPWFITWSGSITFSHVNTDYGISDSENDQYTGRLTVNVFPRSRFPFTATYERMDSALDTASADSPFGITVDTESEQIRLQQSYTSYGGLTMNAWYNTATWSTTDQRDIGTDAGGLSVSKRFINHNLQLNGYTSTTEEEGTSEGTSNSTVTLNHNYAPHTEFNVSTLITQTSAETRSAGLSDDVKIDTLQASSNFYWRPEYRAISMTGGIRFQNQESGLTDANDLDGYLSANYQYSKSLRFSGAINVAAHDTGDSRRGTSTQSLSATYSSDSYYIRQLIYRWQASASASNQVSSGDTADSDIRSASVGFNHDVQRGWGLSQYSQLNLSLGQSFTVGATTGQNDPTHGIGHTARLSWNSTTSEASTGAWLQASDTRNFGDSDTGFQVISAQLNRRETITRLSSLSGNITLQASRQTGEGDGGEFDKTATGRADYSHSRVFGVYRLRFLSRLELQQSSIYESETRQTSSWDNRLDYSIGMLVTSLTFNYQRDNRGQDNKTLLFQVTRRF